MDSTIKVAKTLAAPKSLWQSPVFTFHVLALALHLPLLAVYFRELWSQPHYQSFFVFALAFVAVYVHWRLREAKQMVVSTRGFLPNLFLILALPFSLFANIVFDPDFAAIGCFFLASSLFSRLRDRATDATLLPAVWVLVTVVRLPFKIDILLISKLQIWTSKLASALLDLLGVSHLLAGNVVRVGDKQFGVEEACSGVQSLFLLIFCAIAWSVFSNRSFIRMLLLVLAAIFWASLFNTLRVMMICLAEAWYQIDLATGLTHAILGYISIGCAIAMLVSTDFLLELMFGRFESTASSSNVSQRFSWFYSFLPANAKDETTGKEPKKTAPWRRWAIVVICGILALTALLPWIQVGPSVIWRQLTDKYNVEDITSEILEESFRLESESLGGESVWNVEKFELQERELNSDWGSRSSVWQLLGKIGPNAIRCSLSCDYPFSGWHELSRCYRGNGWTMESRVNLETKTNPEWPVTAVKLNQPAGGHAILLFSLFDESGKPVLPPDRDIVTMNYLERAINAIQQRLTKDYGPTPQTYQVQVIVPVQESVADEAVKMLAEHFAEIREKIRSRVSEDL